MGMPAMYGRMGGMEKTTVYLTTEQKAALARAAEAEGRSEARLIRAGIDAVTSRHRSRKPARRSANPWRQARPRSASSPPQSPPLDEPRRVRPTRRAPPGRRGPARRAPRPRSRRHGRRAAPMSDGLADTSVFIAHESGRPLRVEALPDRLAVSVITIGELRAGVLAARRPGDARPAAGDPHRRPRARARRRRRGGSGDVGPPPRGAP